MADAYQLSLTSLLTERGSIPVLKVELTGNPHLWEVVKLMRAINQRIGQIQGEYISVTDLSAVQISSVLGTVVSWVIDSSFKNLLSVKRPALFSFVLFGEHEQASPKLTAALAAINDRELPVDDYRYRYVFVKREAEVTTFMARLDPWPGSPPPRGDPAPVEQSSRA